MKLVFEITVTPELDEGNLYNRFVAHMRKEDAARLPMDLEDGSLLLLAVTLHDVIKD
jgi:hypothetical protein